MVDGPEPSSDYEHALRGVLERAAEASEAHRKRQEHRDPLLTRPPVIALLALILTGVVVWNIQAFNPTPEPLPPAQTRATNEVSVMVAAQAVEAYRAEHGELPESLEDAGLPLSGFEYRVEGEEYTLTAGEGTAEVRLTRAEALGQLQGLVSPGDGR